jgi:nucleoside-diphosphate-sugar epimerase
MKRVAITGAAGFVGANLTRRLLQDGHELHLLIRPDHAMWRIDDLRGDVRMHDADLGDRERVDSVIEAVKPDWVFHLAAHGAYSWQTNLAEMVRTNINGTMNLAEAAANSGVEAMVNTGSSSEYGYKDHAPSEHEAIEPNSYYALTKASATMFCRFTAQKSGIRMPTLRLYSVYGSYEEPRRLVPTLVVKGLQSRLPPLAKPDTARDYVYIADVVDAYILAATTSIGDPGAVFNVGTGIQTTLHDIVEVTRAMLGVAEEPTWGSLPDRTWDTTIWRADPTHIQTELGWRPRYDVRAGLAETIDWFREHPTLREFYQRQMH